MGTFSKLMDIIADTNRVCPPKQGTREPALFVEAVRLGRGVRVITLSALKRSMCSVRCLNSTVPMRVAASSLSVVRE